jgi:hypothetical protein
MNEMTPPKAERTAALKGLGTERKRVEDARFTQGKGNYVDDLSFPACCSAISSARPMHMPASSRSTPKRRWRFPGSSLF